jgi:D-alanyl-D-alanine carboxypeptidase
VCSSDLSAYRSFGHQAALYAYWVALLGEAQAARTSARAGHSEHQLGTAFDLATAENGYGFEEFGATYAGWWTGANAWRFGFVISYPEGGEEITGYDYEPWHVRFIGVQLAAEHRASGLTLREFLIARGP